MYFTDVEPPFEMIGKKRHFFARSSKVTGTASAIGSAVRTQEDAGMFNQNNNNDVFSVVRDLLSHQDIRQKMENSFKNLDYAQNGFVTKDDFVNVLFENAREC